MIEDMRNEMNRGRDEVRILHADLKRYDGDLDAIVTRVSNAYIANFYQEVGRKVTNWAFWIMVLGFVALRHVAWPSAGKLKGSGGPG